MATKQKTQKRQAAPEPEVELEEAEADEETTGSGSKKQEVTFGVRDLCELIKEKTGKEYKPKDVRTLIRKMARDGSGRVNREIVAGNKSRYDWSGPDDPEVKRILKAAVGGEVEAGRKEALDKLKERREAQKAAKEAAAAAESSDEDEEEEAEEV